VSRSSLHKGTNVGRERMGPVLRSRLRDEDIGSPVGVRGRHRSVCVVTSGTGALMSVVLP